MKKTESINLAKAFIALSLFSVNTYAEITDTEIIYGVDDRIETYEASKLKQRVAKSTAAMISTKKLIDLGDKVLLPPSTIQNKMNLCKDERFADQPSPMSCSGFLVGPDLLVTAGHCVTTQLDCDENAWIFNYAVNEETKRADVLIAKKDVYKCSKLLDGILDNTASNKRDFALIKLDRVVKGTEPLAYRSSGKISQKDQVFVVGHPSGLPQKVTSNGMISDNTPINYFETNLDTFAGNSGSAVFNEKTGLLEGILVRGARDYAYDAEGGCVRVNTVAEEIGENHALGESVSRITDISTLKYRNIFLAYARAGIAEGVKKYLVKIVDKNIYDNKMKAAIHKAVESGDASTIKVLIDAGVDLNAKDINGNTPLHLAVKYNNTQFARLLIKGGAKLYIKNNHGRYANAYIHFFNLSMRQLVK